MEKDMTIDWKKEVLTWLLHQGVSTVLLFTILAVIWQGYPEAVTHIQTGYDRNAKALSDVQSKHEQMVDRLLLRLDRTGKMEASHVDEIGKLIQ